MLIQSENLNSDFLPGPFKAETPRPWKGTVAFGEQNTDYFKAFNNI